MSKRKQKPEIRVIKGDKTAEPQKKAPPLRVHTADTPRELKEQFAENLDRLFHLLGMSRKEVAEKTDLPYKLVQRLASAGVSRVDEKNTESLAKIVKYFALPNVKDLWIGNLIPWLLEAEEGKRFVTKFRADLRRFRDEQIRSIEHINQEQLQMIDKALGIETASSEDECVAAYLERARMILESDRADHFQRLIDDYVELVTKGKATTG